MRWERLQIQGGPEAGTAVGGPRKRWGHTCNATRGGKLFYVFGGYGKDNCQTNQVHVFDTTTRTWSEPVIKGTLPTPRDSHTCTTVGDNLFVFGGTDGMNPLKDLHILDTTSNTWISPTVRGEGPEAREGHSAALIGKRLFIFGGCGKSSNSSDEIYYNDLYILNTETFVWKHAETSGMPPAKRDSHTCSSWKNKIIVVGGEDTCNYYLSDVHILDADTLLWGRLNTSGHHLPPRAGHTTVALGKYLFLFGGFTDEHNLYDDIYMLDVDTGIWTKVAAAGTGPSARFSMAGDTLDPQLGGVLVFIGGCNKNLEALDDMYYLYTGLHGEKDRDERRIEKLSLRKQLKLKCQEKHIVARVNDRALIRVDTNDSLNQSIPAPSYVQPSRPNISVNEYQMPLGKRAFQAKVTKSFPYGYNIETIIDGKLLRGVLFSSKSSFKKAAEDDCNGKGETGELGHANLNVDDSSKPEKSPKNGRIDDRLPDGVNREQSVQSEPLKETADPKMNNPATSDTSQAHKVLGDSMTFVSPNMVSEDNGTSGGASTSNELPKDNEPAAANIVLPLA